MCGGRCSVSDEERVEMSRLAMAEWLKPPSGREHAMAESLRGMTQEQVEGLIAELEEDNASLERQLVIAKALEPKGGGDGVMGEWPAVLAGRLEDNAARASVLRNAALPLGGLAPLQDALDLDAGEGLAGPGEVALGGESGPDSAE